MDSIDVKIITLLQGNARLKNTEIGKNIGLSSPAVAERIKRLEDKGIIEGYTTLIAYQKSGFQLKAMITLSAFMGRLKPFLSKVTTFKEVLNCYRITGNENIIMEVLLKDQVHLQSFIDELITYGEVKTHIILSSVVQNKPVYE
ncbi:Lrp/AsnC family transcriptional regulator [Aquimarina sp. ERC-38]|uniref:Lrp/AsnC family transcriptional regulator n=1 Tax=Aquimarina sp. ERC-38 TaxID=2949996 RepID=UPI0022472735|nr:Lrp/AsnC family transcriptional regulator [Aquimarina sp. ERC-38]UZO80926.1 Lrp/AsnC family transcriptional regulator [Aquimarina sp. ERC-38]